MILFLELLAVAALILLNGYFVAAEYALVTARRTRIQELAPALVFPGHRGVVERPAARAQEIAMHHAVRLDEHEAALRDGADDAQVLLHHHGQPLTVTNRSPVTVPIPPLDPVTTTT